MNPEKMHTPQVKLKWSNICIRTLIHIFFVRFFDSVSTMELKVFVGVYGLELSTGLFSAIKRPHYVRSRLHRLRFSAGGSYASCLHWC